MEEAKKVFYRDPMTEDEFEDYVKENLYNPDGTTKLNLITYEAVGKFKSVRRAIRRGKVSP